MTELGPKTHGPRFSVFLQPPQVGYSAVSYSEDSRAKKRIMAMANSAAKGSKENSIKIQSSPLEFLSFDHFICPREHVRWNRQGDLLSGFEIDNELELLRLLHREVGGLGALQDLVNIRSRAVVQVAKTHAVAHEPSSFDKFRKRVDYGQPIFDREFDDLRSLRIEHGGNKHDYCLSPSFSRGSKCGLNIVGTQHVDVLMLQLERLGGHFGLLGRSICARVGRSAEHGHTREFRTISFSSSSCFPLISGPSVHKPVMLPPGRARLAIKPLATGSMSWVITTGTTVLASLAAWVDKPPVVTITSTLRPISSEASAGRRSSFPSA